MHKVNVVIIFSIFALLCGCSPPFYTPSQEIKTTKIDVSELKSPEICINHTWYELKKDKNGIAQIPASRKVIITNDFSASLSNGFYTETVSCNPIISFYVLPGEEYYLNFTLGDDKVCTLFAFLRSPGEKKYNLAYGAEPGVC